MSTPFMIGKQMPHLNCYRSIKKPPVQKSTDGCEASQPITLR